MPKINIVLDASQLDLIQTCEYKYYLRHVLNRGPLITPEPLDKGTLVHIGKEFYYKALKDHFTWEQALDAGLVAMRERAANDSDLDYADTNRLIKIFEENVTHWKVFDQSIQIIAVEQAFSYVLYEDETFRLVSIGKIDLLFTDNTYENCPMDTKTYARDYPLLRLRNQFSNYALATNSNYLFVDRVGLHGLPGEVQKPKSPAEKHKRVPLFYDPLILESWKQNTIKWYLRHYDSITNNEWPQNFSNCAPYGKECEYYEPICNTSGESNREYNLKNKFKLIPVWDVTAGMGVVTAND
jgi:hypothetical protein